MWTKFQSLTFSMGFVWLKFWWIVLVGGNLWKRLRQCVCNVGNCRDFLVANLQMFYFCRRSLSGIFIYHATDPFNGSSTVYRWDKILPWLTSCSFYGSSGLSPDDFIMLDISEIGEDFTLRRAFFLLLMASLHVSLNQTVLFFWTENLLLGMLFLAMVNNFSQKSSSEIPGLLQPSRLLASLEKEGQSAFTKFPTRNSRWGLYGAISYWNRIMITPTQSLPLHHCMSRKISGLHIIRSIAEDEPVAGWIYVGQVVRVAQTSTECREDGDDLVWVALQSD